MTKQTPSKNKTVTVVGIIVPVEWDEKGNPVVVAISSDDEREFIIENRHKKGKEVKKLLRQRIQVSADLLDSEGERQKIFIKSYTKLDDTHIGDKDGGTLNVL